MKLVIIFRLHCKSEHGKIMALACDECDYTTNDNGNFHAHVKAVHHKIRDLKCNQCDFTASHRYKVESCILYFDLNGAWRTT